MKLSGLTACALALLLSAFATSARAQVTVTEPPDQSTTFPGAVIALGTGVNSVSGSVTTPSDGQDNFQVTVAAGSQLTALSLSLNTGGGFNGFVTFNLGETRSSSGSFTSGLPLGPGTYYVQVVANFAPGNAWSMSFTVAGAPPVCGNGIREGTEACDDGNATQCDGCSACAVVLNGCFIGGVCIADGTAEPGNVCRACRRTVSRTSYSAVTAGTSCDDGQFCTAVDTCNGIGTCTGTSRSCSDSLSCTADACDETANVCVNPVTSGCLVGGACVASGAVSPTNACLACAPGTSTSAYSARPAGTSCDDGQFCTAIDACNGAGTCTGTTRDCSDPLSCTTDSCNESTNACVSTLAGGCLIGGACIAAGTASPTNACLVCNPAASTSAYSPRPAGSACDDGQFCTAVDSCNATGTCTGTTRDCGDPLSCTTDSCNESTNACVNTLAGGCLIGGACIAAGTASPTNACLVCAPAVSTSAYSPRAAGSACDDGQFCTAIDSCNAAGTCTGTTRDCADALGCTTDSCDETANACVSSVSTGCLIGGACVPAGTASPSGPCMTCDPSSSTSAYSPAAAGAACDDGLFCTAVDACDGAGACAGAARDCDDTLGCTTDACDEDADSCVSTVATGCLVDGACVAEGEADPSADCMACDPAISTSAYSPAAAGLTCDDGSFCSVDDACDGSGTCGGAARTCADDDACTLDACDDAAGACTFEAISGCAPDAGMGTEDAGVTDDGGAGDDDGGVTGDGGGVVIDGGGVAVDGGGVVVDGGGTGATSGGCGCRAAGGSSGSGALFLLATVALGLSLRRRRMR